MIEDLVDPIACAAALGDENPAVAGQLPHLAEEDGTNRRICCGHPAGRVLLSGA